MILDELVLHNFGVYEGRQSIELAPPNRKQPIVLFGGLNGGGKTTLLDGLQLALYGKGAQCSNRGALGYTDFLERCINSKVPKSDGAAVEIQFRHRSEGQEQVFRVHRSWRASKGGAIRETVEVFRDGEEDAVLTDSWAEHVEEFMPAGISHLFLFDGEKIEGFADVERSAQLLSTAIGSLLGLDLVEQLSTDLVVLERRKRLLHRDDGERREIAESKDEVERLKERVGDLVAQRASAQNALDLTAKALKKIERKYQKEGGESYEKRSALEAERDSILEQIKLAEGELRELAAGVAPLAAASKLLDRVTAQSARESEAYQARELGSILGKRDAKLTKALKKQDVPEAVAEWLAEYLEKDRAKRDSAANVEGHLQLSREAGDALIAAEKSIPNVLVHTRLVRERIAKSRSQLVKTERKLAAVPTSEAIEELQQRREVARTEVEAARVGLKGIEQELEASRRALEHKKAKLTRLIEKKVRDDFKNEDAARIVHHSKKLQGTLSQFRERLVARHVDRIKKLMLESFHQLLRKESLISNIEIDPRTCAVELRDRTGKMLSPARLSAGERQLLAVSMLWGLARASGRPLPAVIDTPLGRLDSTHRKHLVNRYFPLASHQVLLLSTDEEIDEQYYEDLKPHVGRSYTLSFDDKAGRTEVRDGYFW